jgi:hypothetical protein
VRTEALSTLTKLTTGGKTREHRLLSLMRSPDEPAADWFMHVPICFNNALDIRRTVRVGSPKPVWTQGANFSFAPGDTIYDTSDGYQTWAAALRHIRYCFHVSGATAVSSPTTTAPRQPGTITFTVSAPNDSRTALSHIRTYTVTQDDFVRLLISGWSDQLPLA